MARRPRDDEDDDFNDDDNREDPPFPGVVRAAGVLWIVLSTFFLFGSCLSYFVIPLLLQLGNDGPRKPAPTEVCSFGLGIGLAVAFFVFGLLTVRGSVKDTIAGSLLSLVVGVLYVLAGVAGVVFGLSGPNALWGVGVLAAALGCLCILPGVLGLTGRSRYLKWRVETDPRRRRRREWEEDEEEEDDDRDRPKRRRVAQPVVPTMATDCPRCFQTVHVPVASAGGVCPCPRCGNELDVPAKTE